MVNVVLHSITSSLLGASKKGFLGPLQVHALEAYWSLAKCQPEQSEGGEFVVEESSRNLRVFADCKFVRYGENSEVSEVVVGDDRTRRHRGAQPAAQLEDHSSSSLTQTELEEIMLELSNSVTPWEQGGFTRVRHLQDAERNQGRVDLMKSSESQGSRFVAVKRMPTAWVQRGPKEFEAEYPESSERPWHDMGIVSKLNAIGFPYACELKGVFCNDESTFVVTSLATDGDLHTWCHLTCRPGQLREQRIRPIAGQLFAAVRWLHDLGIAHRDLSLENILLTRGKFGEPLVRLIDFGMATLSQKARGEALGKPVCQAPETHGELLEYDAFLADDFALGVVLFAMAAQDYPWVATEPNSCRLYEYVRTVGFRTFLEKRKLRHGCGENLMKVFSPDLVDVLEGLLEANPEERLTLGESCYTAERRSVWNERWMESWDGGVSPDGEVPPPL